MKDSENTVKKDNKMRQSLKLFSLFILLLCVPLSAFAVEMKITGEDIRMASTECTDGTQFFASWSDIFLVRNGDILYHEPVEFSQIFSVYCLKHAIVYTGRGGSEQTNILYYENDFFVKKKLEGYARSIRIVSTEAKTIIFEYDYEKNSNNKRLRGKTLLNKPMLIPENSNYESISVNRMLKVKSIRQPVAVTTMLSHCPEIRSYIGYVDENNVPKFGSFDYYSDTVIYDSTQLPFVATNSFCVGDEAYFFGKKDGKLRAGKVVYNDKTGRNTVKLIPLSQVPLKPYIK